jgi:hypothetical protein
VVKTYNYTITDCKRWNMAFQTARAQAGCHVLVTRLDRLAQSTREPLDFVDKAGATSRSAGVDNCRSGKNGEKALGRAANARRVSAPTTPLQ